MAIKITRKQLTEMVRKEIKRQRKLKEQQTSASWYDEEEEAYDLARFDDEDFAMADMKGRVRDRVRTRKPKGRKDIKMKKYDEQTDYEAYLDNLSDLDGPDDTIYMDRFQGDEEEEWSVTSDFESLFDNPEDLDGEDEDYFEDDYEDEDDYDW